jgi:hypothetical protein
MAVLGYYWNNLFEDKATVLSLTEARGAAYYQAYLDTLDLIACHSKFTVPIFRNENWRVLSVLESEKDSSPQLTYKYGSSGLAYENVTRPAYGDKANDRYFSFALPEGCMNVQAAYNRVLSPSLVWLEGSDFAVDPELHVIHFTADPFADPLVPKRDILDSEGNVVDREFVLWLRLSEWDLEYVYEQFGYALGIWMKSSTFYREFISALYDNLVLGPTKTTLKLALSALSGIPFAKEAEVVEKIIDESPNFKYVQTDKNIYTFKASCGVVVQVGDTLTTGDLLVDSIRVVEPDSATDWSPFIGMAMSKSMLGGGYLSGPIVFENKQVDVEYVGLDAGGNAVVQFSVSGFPADVEKFWAEAHKTGVALGRTMADLLDTRAVRATPTTESDLPATVNPFTFAMDNILTNNLYLVALKPEDFAAGAPGIGGLDHLYKYVAPQSSYMIFVEMDGGSDYHSFVNGTDSVEFLQAVPTMSDNAASLRRDFGPTIRSVREACR